RPTRFAEDLAAFLTSTRESGPMCLASSTSTKWRSSSRNAAIGVGTGGGVAAAGIGGGSEAERDGGGPRVEAIGSGAGVRGATVVGCGNRLDGGGIEGWETIVAIEVSLGSVACGGSPIWRR